MFHKSLILALSTLLIFSACSSKKKPKPKPPIVTNNTIKQKALIIGVSDYAGNNNDLGGINLDINKMQTLFTSWGFDVDTLTHSLSFEQKMAQYASTLNNDDVFIFYYSGHGSFTPDTSHDELDGQDELIVLSDSDTNLYILDDKINILLNKIKARKLIIFDSCNSGTSLKSSYSESPSGSAASSTQVKFMTAPKSAADNSIQNTNIPNTDTLGTYLYYAACRDDEQSLASSSGSLFTNAFVNNVQLTQSASWTHQKTLDILKSRFHPKLSASNENLKNSTLKTYLKIQ